MKQFLKTTKKGESTHMKTLVLSKIEHSMRQRRILNYGYKEIWHYLWWCVICRRKKSLRRKPGFRDHLYFEVGQEKLLDELDWVTLIKSIRNLKILTQLLLKKRQKFLIKFQRNNIIDSSSSGTSDEGQMNIVNLMKSKNKKYTDIIDRKVKQVIDEFHSTSLKDTDLRVIKGVIKKRFSDEEIDDNESSNLYEGMFKI